MPAVSNVIAEWVSLVTADWSGWEQLAYCATNVTLAYSSPQQQKLTFITSTKRPVRSQSLTDGRDAFLGEWNHSQQASSFW